MALNLSDHNIIDSHCHFLLPDKETKDFECYWNLSRLPIESKHLRNALNYKMLLKELRVLLSVDKKANDEEVVSARNKMYKKDAIGYIKMLFRTANIEAVLIDTGVPNLENYGYTVSFEDFQNLLPKEVIKRCIVRIEPIIFKLLLKEGLSFQELVFLFEQELDESIRNQKAIALKTTIAYHTGLDIKILHEAQASEAYIRYRKCKAGDLNAEKEIRDYFLLLSLEKCIQLDIPMQVHAGIGDAPVLDLMKSNPLLLFNLIRDPYFQKAKIVIEHLGYPYIRETGSLANMFPNIWVDFSEINAFISQSVVHCLHELLEMTPVTKILYGSDSYGVPDIFWFSAVHFKKSLEKVLKDFMRDSVFSPDYAQFVADRILRENAWEFYKLGNSPDQ
jgi:uncharacterized protein